MKPVQKSAPVACSLDQKNQADRQRRWRALADRALLDVTSTGRGLRMRFRDGPGVDAELRALATLERDCCSFAEWTVLVHDAAVAIDVSGESEESVAAVQAMFTSLRAAATRTSSREFHPGRV
jgi:hypothetical protein